MILVMLAGYMGASLFFAKRTRPDSASISTADGAVIIGAGGFFVRAAFVTVMVGEADAGGAKPDSIRITTQAHAQHKKNRLLQRLVACCPSCNESTIPVSSSFFLPPIPSLFPPLFNFG
ncbi:MAG TPA: hypothetical protein VIK75_04215 [Calditerricola sp.]